MNPDTIDLGTCSKDKALEYLFAVLTNKEISSAEKEKVLEKILGQYLNLKTNEGRLIVVTCIIPMCVLLATMDFYNLHLFMKVLIRAVREGRIPKVVARAIAKKLMKKGVPVDPELMKVIDG